MSFFLGVLCGLRGEPSCFFFDQTIRLLRRGDITQTNSQIGRADSWIHGLVGIVHQNIDIGYIPAMPRVFYLGEPPSVFSDNHPGINPIVKFCALLDPPSRRFDRRPSHLPRSRVSRPSPDESPQWDRDGSPSATESCGLRNEKRSGCADPH